MLAAFDQTRVKLDGCVAMELLLLRLFVPMRIDLEPKQSVDVFNKSHMVGFSHSFFLFPGVQVSICNSISTGSGCKLSHRN